MCNKRTQKRTLDISYLELSSLLSPVEMEASHRSGSKRGTTPKVPTGSPISSSTTEEKQSLHETLELAIKAEDIPITKKKSTESDFHKIAVCYLKQIPLIYLALRLKGCSSVHRLSHS